jgi:hypothetical protein
MPKMSINENARSNILIRATRTIRIAEGMESRMERATADKIVQSIVALHKSIGDIDLEISKMPEGKEKDSFVKALGVVIGAISNEIIFPIVQEYPDLNPYEQI